MLLTRSKLAGCNIELGDLARLLAVVALLLVHTGGCRFDKSGRPPPDRVATCAATVRAESGAGTEFDLSNEDPELDGRLLATWCPSGNVMADWQAHLADTLGAADFRGHPGPWCVVEGSEVCDLGDNVDRDAFPACSPPLSTSPLGYCPDPPEPRCVQVDPLLDFGTVPVGETRVVTLGVANTCNEEVGVQVGESIHGPQADEFEVFDNRCTPPAGEDFLLLAATGSPGERCEVDVRFMPWSPLTRSAEYRFTEAPATSVVVQLRGEGLGAIAMVTPDYLCLDGTLSGPDQCTPPGEYRIDNPGPGGIRVVDGMWDPASGTGFRLVPPELAVDSFIPGGSPAFVRVEWCQSLASAIKENAIYIVTLTTNSAATESTILEMERPCP